MNEAILLSGAGALFAPAQSKDLRLLFVHALSYTVQWQAVWKNLYADTAWAVSAWCPVSDSSHHHCAVILSAVWPVFGPNGVERSAVALCDLWHELQGHHTRWVPRPPPLQRILLPRRTIRKVRTGCRGPGKNLHGRKAPPSPPSFLCNCVTV
jgi:hypothetical protein